MTEFESAALKALLQMRGFVAMFHGDLTLIDKALELGEHPQEPVEQYESATSAQQR